MANINCRRFYIASSHAIMVASHDEASGHNLLTADTARKAQKPHSESSSTKTDMPLAG